jgi:hypothetical protein
MAGFVHAHWIGAAPEHARVRFPPSPAGARRSATRRQSRSWRARTPPDRTPVRRGVGRPCGARSARTSSATTVGSASATRCACPREHTVHLYEYVFPRTGDLPDRARAIDPDRSPDSASSIIPVSSPRIARGGPSRTRSGSTARPVRVRTWPLACVPIGWMTYDCREPHHPTVPHPCAPDSRTPAGAPGANGASATSTAASLLTPTSSGLTSLLFALPAGAHTSPCSAAPISPPPRA